MPLEGLQDLLDALRAHREMRGPLPDLQGPMDRAATQLGLPDLQQEAPDPWTAISAMIGIPGDMEPYHLPEYAGELGSYNGGIRSPFPGDLGNVGENTVGEEYEPQIPIPPEQLNASPLPGDSPLWDDPTDKYVQDMLNRGRADSRQRPIWGNIDREYPQVPDPSEWPFENLNATNVSSSLMDLVDTPGFKIGLGGTGALMLLLEYLGANALEEVTP